MSRLDEAMERLSSLVVTRFRLARAVAELAAAGANVRELTEIMNDSARQLRDLERGVLERHVVEAVAGKPLFGYLSAILLIAASALAIPAIADGLLHASTPGLQKIIGVEGLLASRSLIGSLRRTSVLVGALSTAIA